MLLDRDDYDPDALLRDPCDNQDEGGQECPVCGELLVWSHGTWVCFNCTGEIVTPDEEEGG